MARLLDVFDANDVLGEGPVWNAQDGRLWWTDIQQSRLRRLDPATGLISDLATPERVGAFALVAGAPDRLLVGFETGLAFYDTRTGAIDWLQRPELGGTGRRFNDGRTDRQGRFWIGTMVEDEARAGAGSAALWRVDPNGRMVACQPGVAIANGLCASPDGRTLYFADSPRQRIDAFDLDPETGAISNRRLFAQVERGYPDGATVDAEGRVWSARWGAGEVVCHAPDGKVLDVVQVPASQPTCVAFGGPDLSLMFVTSAKDGLTSADLAAQPSAGSLFIFESGAMGLAEVPYRPAQDAA